MKMKVVTIDNKAAGEVTLNKSIFGLEPRKDVLQRVVRWQLARRQAGTHKTQERSEVTATTAKMFKQKGTGNARHGSKKASQFVGGGTVFGPRVRSHAHNLTKKFRKLGLKTALSAKAAEGKIVVVDSLVTKDAKTATMSKKLEGLGVNKPLFVRGEKVNDEFVKSVRNLPYVDVIADEGLNVYDILRHDSLVITSHALKNLEERLS
jgi:large subunit ribosomal protein L4